MAEKDKKGKEELADATEHDGTADTQEGDTRPEGAETAENEPADIPPTNPGATTQGPV